MKSRWIVVALVVIAVGLVLMTGSIAFLGGLYTQRWDGPVASFAANTFPIPAARVGNRRILYREYLRDIQSVETFLRSEIAESNGVNREMMTEDKRITLERLIEEAILEELALERNITVSDEELDSFTQQAIDEFALQSGQTSADIGPVLQNTYGWTLDDFKRHIVRPAVLDRMLTASYATDHGGDMTAFEQYMTERLAGSDIARYIQFPSG